MATKEFQERKALKALQFEQWEYDAQLYVGADTIAKLLAKGWIERLPEGPYGKKCRITELGRAALAAPIAPKPTTKRKPLKMIGPRIKIADLSIAKAKR